MATLFTGSILGYIGGWWERAWFWASIVLLFVIAGFMTPLVAAPYNKVRRALGLKVVFASKKEREKPAPKLEEIDGVLRSARPVAAAIVGFVGTAIILWLMMFKPF